MPPTGAETKVKDPEYKNWLRVGLALYYLKDGLHSFIQGEVDAMHQSLLQNLYVGTVVPKPKCFSCMSKDVKQNRNTYIWKFRSSCPSSLCDVWLKELMTFHANPTSNKIYWENCDVTAWPFVPWECAKLYMPRGQPPSNLGPPQSDAQALLTLMATCTYFHGKLSPACLTLTHTVSKIRNTVMHSGDMRLSDGERKSFIQDIIHLLEDQTHLISLEECKQAVDEINRINDDSLDVFFNIDLEMKTLRECINDCRQELGIRKKDTEVTVESLKEEFIKLKDQFDSYAKETKDKVGDLDAKCQQIDTSVTIVSSGLENVKQKVSKLDKEIQEVQASSSEAKDQFDNLAKETKDKFGDLDAKCQQIDTSVTIVSSGLENVKQKVSKLDKEIQEVQASSSEAKDQFDNHAKETKDKFGDLDAKCQQIDTSVTIVSSGLENVKQKVSKLDKEIQEVQASSSEAKDQFDNHAKETKDKFGDLDAKCQQIDTSVTIVSSGLENAKQHLSKHDKEIQEVKASISETTKKTDHLSTESIESDISILQNRLIEAYRRQRVIQISPTVESKRCDIENVYVDLIIVDQAKCKQAKEKGQYKGREIDDSNSEKSDSAKTIQVTSYRQMFLDSERSRYKRIYLRGKGGMGKTTFCRKLLHSWCNVHERKTGDQSTAHNEIIAFEDELELCMFKILFYVSLRDVSDEKTLIEVICAQLPFEEGSDENILKVLLKQNEDEVLFVLDGLDELTPKARFIELILNRTLYTNSTFLISSRPWKIAQMELQEGPEIDLMLHLEGFSHNNAMRFAEKVLKSCYDDERATAQFEKEIKSNTLTKQLVQVPLLLLFLVHVWYKNQRSLSKTLHELYLQFFDVMVDRVKEKYKKDNQRWQMVFLNGDEKSSLPSKISGTSLVKTFGVAFLASLCKVAHHFLLSSQKEISLVFDETELIELLGDKGREKLNVVLDLGILSVTDSVSYLRRKTSVSFLHKTMQEFLTSVYFISNPDELENFISSMADLNDVLQNENIIVFMAGLDPQFGNKLLGKACDLCDDDEKILQYRSAADKLFPSSIPNISSLYQKCMEECTGSDVQLYVSDMCLMKSKLNLNTVAPTFLRSIHLQGPLTDLSFVLLDLRAMTGLQYLRLSDDNYQLYLPQSGSLSVLIIIGLKLSSSCCDMLVRTLTHCTQLKKLELFSTDLHNCELDLSNMMLLSELTLSNLKLSSSCCDVLVRTLTHCTQLKRLILQDTDLHNSQLDLYNMTVLSSFNLLEPKLSSSCYDTLGRTLTHCTQLKKLALQTGDLHNYQLDLSNMTVISQLWLARLTLSSSCCDTLGKTLSCCTQLKHLSLFDTNLHNCQLDLSNMTVLSELRMAGVTLSSSCCDVLGRTLKHCTQLKTFYLEKQDLHNCQLDLSNMTVLSKLTLERVTLSSSCCDVLGRTLKHCTQLKKFDLKKQILHDCQLDLSNMTVLSELTLERVTLSSSCCDVLGRTLKHCTHLKHLALSDINLHSCQLDLSNRSVLLNLWLANITLSSSSCDVLGRNLTHCTWLETLYLSGTGLHNCQLIDLSNMTVVSRMTLNRVTLTSSSCDTLGTTLTRCTQLKNLSLRDINLHNCQLDLSNMTVLSELTLTGVTLSSSCCDVLGRTLKHCTQLNKLQLEDTDFHNCQLDLSNMTVLSTLILRGVKLSSSCCDVLGRTLKHCTQLKTFYLKNQVIHNCQLDLSIMTVLSDLRLTGVTLSSSCCDVLGRTLKHCTHLKELQLEDTDLHNCQLDLSNMTVLSTLILRGVKLSSSCCDVLGRTLKHCTHLKHLQLEDTYLHNCQLDLSNINTEITRVVLRSL